MQNDMDVLIKYFPSKYSGISEEHIISILFLRGMSRSDCKQIASDILSNDEVDNNNCEDEMKSGIFQDVKVYTGLMNVKNILLEKINAAEK